MTLPILFVLLFFILQYLKIRYELSVLFIFILPYLRGLSQFPPNSLDDASPKSMEASPLTPEKNPAFLIAFQLFLPSPLSVLSCLK